MLFRSLPGPVGAFLACGGDWRAAVLNVVLIAIGVCIYYPFFRAWEKQILDEEKQDESEAAKAC